MNNKYLVVGDWHYRLLREAAEHHRKWMVDLFGPKGLEILFAQKAISKVEALDGSR